jgi:DNA replication protein DnaC
MIISLQQAKSSAALFQKKNLVDFFCLGQDGIFGREKQLAHLGRVYERISTSKSEVVMIHGPFGIGKSALLEAFVRE